MASWREIERFKKDVDGFRALAARLLEFRFDGLSEWEIPFLESVSRKTDAEEFSTRQAEKLLEIRDATELIETVQGFSVKSLVRQIHLARVDLSEDDEAWIVRLADAAAVRRKDAYRLLRCARELEIIDMEIPA